MFAIAASVAVVNAPVVAPEAAAPVHVPQHPAAPADPQAPTRTTMRCHTDLTCVAFPTASAHRGPFLGAATTELLTLVEGTGVTAYDLATGARRWQADLDIDPQHPVPRVAAVEGEAAVMVAIAAGQLAALDTADGRAHRRWSAPGVEEVFAVRAVATSWQATVRTRQDNESRNQVVALSPDAVVDTAELPIGPVRPRPGAAGDADPSLPPRCCNGIAATAADDGLVVGPLERMPGGRRQIHDATTGIHLADLTLATYHGQALGDGRWLFVAPYQALIVAAVAPPAG